MEQPQHWTGQIRAEEFGPGSSSFPDRAGPGEISVDGGRVVMSFKMGRWRRLLAATPTEYEITLATVVEWRITPLRIAMTASSGALGVDPGLSSGAVVQFDVDRAAEELTAVALQAGLDPNAVRRD